MKDTGPKIFLRRLVEAGINVSDIELLNPSLEDINNRSKTKKILIGRLDGTSYYDFSIRNLQKFLALRNYNRISKVIGTLPLLKSSRVTNRLLNRYLDRTCSWLLTNANGLVFQSKISLEMHKTFLDFDDSSKPYRIINNGVNVDLFSPQEEVDNSFGFPSVIISASQYRLHKRLQEAVKLVNYLSTEFPKIRLNVVGEMDFLTSTCLKKLDTSRCNFHGRVSPERLPYFYKNADIQLHLSIFDPCPNVVVEGLASGLPVITPLESGAEELVGKSNSNWVVAEQLDMQYMELHREEKIPTINLPTYSNVFAKIFDNLKANQNSARARAERSLDIKSAAKQYQQFFTEMKEGLDE